MEQCHSNLALFRGRVGYHGLAISYCRLRVGRQTGQLLCSMSLHLLTCCNSFVHNLSPAWASCSRNFCSEFLQIYDSICKSCFWSLFSHLLSGEQIYNSVSFGPWEVWRLCGGKWSVWLVVYFTSFCCFVVQSCPLATCWGVRYVPFVLAGCIDMRQLLWSWLTGSAVKRHHLHMQCY